MEQATHSEQIIKLDFSVIQSLAQQASGDLTAGDRDEMAIPSHTHSNPLIRWLMWRRYEVIAELFPHRVEEALEFGCGLGLFLPTLAMRAERVHAIDLFTRPAERTVSVLGLDVRLSDSLDGIEEKSLDLIVAADVLEHLESPERTVGQFRSLLKPGGKLVVSGPTESLVYKFGRVLAGFGDKGDYHHTDIAALRRVIESVGFRTTTSRILPFRYAPSLFEVHQFEI